MINLRETIIYLLNNTLLRDLCPTCKIMTEGSDDLSVLNAFFNSLYLQKDYHANPAYIIICVFVLSINHYHIS